MLNGDLIKIMCKSNEFSYSGIPDCLDGILEADRIEIAVGELLVVKYFSCI